MPPSTFLRSPKQRDQLTSWLLGASALGCFLYFVTAYPPTALLGPDTITYVKFTWYRPPTYGLFVHALGKLTGSVYPVALIQLGLSLVSGIVFARVVGSLTRSHWITLVLGLLLTFHGPARVFDFKLQTESLSLSTTLLCLSAALNYWKTGKLSLLGWASALVVIGASLRPTSLVLGLPVVFCWLARPRPSASRTLWSILPACVLLATWSASNYYRFNRWSPFIRGGDVLFSATAHYLQAGMDHEHSALTDYYARGLAPTREKLAAAYRRPGKNPYEWLKRQEQVRQETQTALFYGYPPYYAAQRHLLAYVTEHKQELCPRGSFSGKYHLPSCRDGFAKHLAHLAIRQAAGQYLQRVLTSLMYYVLRTHDLKPLRLADFEMNPALIKRDPKVFVGPGAPYQGVLRSGFENYPTLTGERPWLLYVWHDSLRQRSLRALFGPWRNYQLLGLLNAALATSTLLLLAGTVGVRFTRRRWPALITSPAFVIAVVMYSTYWAYYLAYATHHPAISRYAVAMEPVALASLVTLLGAGTRLLLQKSMARRSSNTLGK